MFFVIQSYSTLQKIRKIDKKCEKRCFFKIFLLFLDVQKHVDFLRKKVHAYFKYKQEQKVEKNEKK